MTINGVTLMEAVCAELKKLGYDISIWEYDRVNGKAKGLVVRVDEKKVVPIFREEFFNQFDEEDTLESVCDTILELLKEFDKDEDIAYKIQDKDYILENATVAVCRKDWSEEFLKTVPYREIEGTDLVLYPRVILDNSSSVTFSGFGVSDDELFEAGIKNFEKSIIFTNISECMLAMSNELYLYGAAVIAFPEVLRKVMEVFDTYRLVIIPSSVHELIAVPEIILPDREYVDEMINEVNECGAVGEYERLSDHAYIFDGEKFV